MRALIGLAAVVLFAGLYANLSRRQSASAQDVRPIPTQTGRDELRELMFRKLAHSQDVLHGLVTRDLDRCAAAADKLQQINLTAPKRFEGNEQENEVYQHFKLEFLRLSAQLKTMAEKENLEGTAYAYQNLTASCLACHSFLAGEKPTIIVP